MSIFYCIGRLSHPFPLQDHPAAVESAGASATADGAGEGAKKPDWGITNYHPLEVAWLLFEVVQRCSKLFPDHALGRGPCLVFIVLVASPSPPAPGSAVFGRPDRHNIFRVK